MNTLITGAANGLGAALAHRAVPRSFKVVGLDREWDNNSDHSVIQLTRDLQHPLNWSADETLLSHGPFTTVIHNAAISATGPFEDIPLKAHEAIMAVNLKAPLLLTHGLLKADALPPGSALVFIASLSVKIGYPGAASYAASKAALANFAKSMRKTLKPHGIHVMVVYPGPMDTAQASRHSPEGANPEKRMDADAVARNIWFAIDKRLPEFTPGTHNQIFSALGQAAPRFMDRMMRKIIYDKLDKTVY